MAKPNGLVIALGKPSAVKPEDESEDGGAKVSAMKAFMSAVKSGDAEAAVEVFTDLQKLCGYEGEEEEE